MKMKFLALFILMTTMIFGNEVNIYTHRHYDTDKQLFSQFEKETGIKVNVVKAKASQLIKKIEIEGKDTPADVLITVDAGRLYEAKAKGLLQNVKSEKLEKNIPSHLRDADNNWFGLTYRARIIAYNPEKTDVKELSTYEALTDKKWKGKIVVRSSTNIYNQSLIASMIVNNGYDKTFNWAENLVKNFARNPKGNDRAQAKAVYAGQAELAIMNTYYMGKMFDSKDPKERAVARSLKIFFPNQNDRGTHINISGAGVVKHSKNRENAIKFIEFLSSKKAQKLFAEANYEYPVHPEVQASDLVKSWGEFKADNLNLSKLGEYGKKATILADRAGWK